MEFSWPFFRYWSFSAVAAAAVGGLCHTSAAWDHSHDFFNTQDHRNRGAGGGGVIALLSFQILAKIKAKPYLWNGLKCNLVLVIQRLIHSLPKWQKTGNWVGPKCQNLQSEFKGEIAFKFDLCLLNAYKLMYFYININGNKDLDEETLEGNEWVFCNLCWIFSLRIFRPSYGPAWGSCCHALHRAESESLRKIPPCQEAKWTLSEKIQPLCKGGGAT